MIWTAATCLLLALEGIALSSGKPPEASLAPPPPDAPRPSAAEQPILLPQMEVERLLWQERPSRATDAALELLAAYPDRPEVRNLAGACLLRTFRPLEAVEAWRPLLENRRWRMRALERMVASYLAAGRDDEAASLLLRHAPLEREAFRQAAGLYVRVFPNGPRRIAALEILARRPDTARQAEEELRASRHFMGYPASVRSTGQGFPHRAKIREVYREPSVRVRLDDSRKAWVAFDTGAGFLLNRDIVRKLDLEPVATILKQGLGYKGPAERDVYSLSKLDIGGLAFSNVRTVVNRRDSEFRSNKAGYMGLELLRRYVVLYDRRGGVLEIWPEGTPAADILGEPGVAMPVMWSRNRPLVPLRIQDRDSYPALFDTGAALTFLDQEKADVIGARANLGKYRNRIVEGFSGAFSLRVAEQVDLRFAGEEFNLRRLHVGEVPQVFDMPVYAVIGRDLLNRYRIVIDGPGSEITVAPYSWAAPETPAGS